MTSFIDEVTLLLRGGDGGRGCVSFRREKYVPRGGPDGGDGGRGGRVELRATRSFTTLAHLRHARRITAGRGEHGQGSNCQGRSGEDRLVEVPVGTLVIDAATCDLLADLVEEGQTLVAARGGKGGFGNARFATSTHRAPREAQPGGAGEEREVRLELHLLADVGLVGLPNAGKSTLISRISAARPKIADYPFTTLHPNLGVVDLPGYRTCVVADIPGLIEGAHRGQGLGIRFLRHIERTRLLLHLVDVADPEGRDPVESYRSVREELSAYDPRLLDRPQVVVATKLDAVSSEDPCRKLRAWCLRRRIPFQAVSAATGRGIPELVLLLARLLPTAEPARENLPRAGKGGRG